MQEIIRSNYPLVDDLAFKHCLDSLKTSWGPKRNQYKERCEVLLAKELKKKHCLILSHGTGALITALKAIGVKDNVKVGVPSLTWVSCASAIVIAGGNPVFLDIDQSSFCIGSKALKQIKQNNIKFVVGVNLLGNLIDIEIINELKNLDVKIIEDAAESLGGSYKNGIKSGSLGDIACFSFHATKLITSGQGGAVVTDDDDLFEKLKSISHHGINTKKSGKYYWSNELGFNFAVSDFQCALISAQIPLISKRVAHLKDVYKKYKNIILSEEGYQFLSLMVELENQNQSFWLPLCSLKESKKIPKNKSLMTIREEMVKTGENYGVEIRPCFYPLHFMPTFKEYYKNNKTDLGITEEVSYKNFALPSGAGFNINNAKNSLERIRECYLSLL
ncbi:DegT/DnrJ/EryC1/StrS family aminotransferase [Prochlorococcus sp. AH-716-B20]|nr:DegT/DnrJ/EryC1/StrS family aminotransferase [Prochlorococcus sp. AH-716-B20]